MSETSRKPISGACLCGAIEFSVELPTLFCGHCHCTMCQRNHGAGFVTWFAVPKTQFSLDRGDSMLMRFESSDHGSRSFCGQCGSSLFCESTTHKEQIDLVRWLVVVEPVANLPDAIQNFTIGVVVRKALDRIHDRLVDRVHDLIGHSSPVVARRQPPSEPPGHHLVR